MRDLFYGEAKIAVFLSLLLGEISSTQNLFTDVDETFGDPREREKEYDDDENPSQGWWWCVFRFTILVIVSHNYQARS